MRNLLVVATLIAACSIAGLAHAAPPCGSTVAAGDTLVLDADITGCAGTGIIVSGGAKLNLAAHAIACTGPSSIGIQLIGKGAKVFNGQVTGCNVAISVEGEGKHSISRVYLNNGGPTAVHIQSGGNKLTTSVIAGRAGADPSPTDDLVLIEAGADKNTLRGNLIIDTDGDGIDLRSNGNKVTGNVTVNAGDSGMDENDDLASGNSFQKNITFRSGYSGIDLDGYGSKASKNLVVSGGYGINIETPSTGPATGETVVNNVVLESSAADLDDENPMCTPNVWKKNVFQTSGQSCVH